MRGIILLMKYYPYENFKNDTNRLLKQLGSYQPDVIVGIARGGLSLAHAMAEGLNIREVQTIRTELYDKSNKRESLSIFGSCDFCASQKVLIVDDIADSGETLQAVMEYFEREFKDTTFTSATLFYKKTSVYEPHYWVNEAKEWIDFFWESDFKKTRI